MAHSSSRLTKQRGQARKGASKCVRTHRSGPDQRGKEADLCDEPLLSPRAERPPFQWHLRWSEVRWRSWWRPANTRASSVPTSPRKQPRPCARPVLRGRHAERRANVAGHPSQHRRARTKEGGGRGSGSGDAKGQSRRSRTVESTSQLATQHSTQTHHRHRGSRTLTGTCAMPQRVTKQPSALCMTITPHKKRCRRLPADVGALT